jgi:hypothetical protein
MRVTGLIFESLSTKKMAHLIGAAHRRVIFAGPGVRIPAAEALVAAAQRCGSDRILVAIDCDESVMRMGYGEIEAVLKLREAGIAVRQSSGFRSAVLICDDQGWVYTPVALYLEPEPQSDETPNALRLSSEQIQEIAIRLSPAERKTAIEEAATPEDRDRLQKVHIEVGVMPVSEEQVKAVSTSLKEAPPVSFDVARQVRVFQPYIQYVEMNLVGCAIERHRVEIPKAIQKLGASGKLKDRLRTTFDLLERDSKLSSKDVEDELRQIRENFTRSLGKPWGRVLLRTARAVLDERVATLRKKLDKHKASVQEKLAGHIKKSREEVVEYYLPIVAKNPPDELLGQLLAPKPSKNDIRAWLDYQLHRVFPKAEDLITDMRLDVQFRDVTYETLNEDGFVEALRGAYPQVNWEKPYNEFKAAKAREE